MTLPPSPRRLGLILLDERSKLPANCGLERHRRIVAKSAGSDAAVPRESATEALLLNRRALGA
jgi:hypothetical protein